jgi:hypothetical protein
MTAPVARIGLGATVTFGTSGAEFEVVKADWDGLTRTAHETTHLGTTQPTGVNHGSRTFIPGKVTDPGTLTLEGHWNAAEMNLIEGALETVTIAFGLESGQTTADTYSGNAFVVSVGGISIEPDAKIMQTIQLKLSGVWTYTAAT